MGIYTNCSLYGIKMYIMDDNDNTTTLLEINQDTLMNDEQIKEAYLFYEKSQNKQNISFQIYTECSSTLYEKGVFMMWYKIYASDFLRLFDEKKILLKKQFDLINT